MKFTRFLSAFSLAILFSASLWSSVSGQTPAERDRQQVRTVTIPISIYTKKELRQGQAEEFVQADRLTVIEDDDEQTILSIRSVAQTPMALAVLIQDDLSTEFNTKLEDIRRFIRGLPKGSRVMVAYIRGGSLQVRQRFTDDLERAARAVRIVTGSGAAPRSPYDGVADALNRFDALPTGRRAILLFSDGLDTSEGIEAFSSVQSTDMQRAVLNAQRKSVAVYSIYSSTSLTASSNSQFVLNGQSGLVKLSDETGGRAFFQGSGTPVNLEPFFRDLNLLLGRQFSLTYLSTHMDKGYHKVRVTSTNPEVKIEHPRGYYYR